MTTCSMPSSSVVVAARRRPPCFVPTLQAFELGRQHRRLQRVEPAVPPDRLVHVLLPAAVVAHQANPLRDVGVVREHRAAVAVRAEVLPRIEARARGEPDPARGSISLAGAVRLRGVLDQAQVVPASDDLLERRHVGHLAVEVHGDDRRACDR